MVGNKIIVGVLIKNKVDLDALIKELPGLTKVFDFRHVWAETTYRNTRFDFILFDYAPSKPMDKRKYADALYTLVHVRKIKAYSINYLKEPHTMFKLINSKNNAQQPGNADTNS